MPIPVTDQTVRATLDRLRAHRLAKDLTYEALAFELEMSRRNLFRVMHDQTGALLDRTLYRMRRYLDEQDAQEQG